MGNEPGFGTPWAYVFAGAPWRTQDVVQKILAQVFTTDPGGLPGNDDLGALSSWQAWAMLGLYPAVPGVGGFVLTTPVFTRTTLTLGGGKTLVITRSGDGPYVQSATLNGKPLTRAWVGWDEIAAGGSLDFTVGPAANTSWGASATDRPPAFYP
jgi:putative alpha-1,2-mannosidase